jgi:hypothetical protein
MSKPFDQGKDEVAKLCQYFATNQQSFLAPGVKEAHVRQSLIDPFFKALGWDVGNDSMTAPQYREVIPEDSLDVEGQQKAPDYTFRVGTLPKFYVEAKKCGVNISADPAPAYQLRRYGFSAKLALSILTDFDELGVYDCASRPRPGDKASHARIQYLCFTEYPDRWRDIWDVFSREAVWSGSFDQYAASKRKRGTSEVDSEFLKDIEGWRDVLARNLALRNGDLSVDDLNAAVQRIIDRIVFLRMAEDRGLESYGQILKLCEQPDIYDRFMNGLCRKADEKYNSGLFHFQKETGVSDAPDTLTPRLAVDDNALKPILQSLYFEHGSPYNFGVLPVEILGTVYERFLGKVIRLTAGHQAKVEEKPEVRKAGGVYYTPAYIVNYIVHNTIGKQIEGKSPADLAGGKTTPPFRVLDMACGSGSFLLGAYQALLDHCLMWHQANLSPKHAKAVYQNDKGDVRLTIAERKRILTTHIYGVDIDRQAVETTKLSLLLKALEGENDASLSQQMTLFHERALPNLSLNIKCGNSLIASDFSMIPEDLVRVRAFDWPTQFPDVMKDGGFDAVIGNPPYGMPDNEVETRYFSQRYSESEGRFDYYELFVLKGLQLCKPRGLFGFIIPSPFLTNLYTRWLRRSLKKDHEIVEITNFGMDVFDQPTVHTCILVIAAKSKQTRKVRVREQVKNPDQLFQPCDFEVNIDSLTANANLVFDIFVDPQTRLILNKMEGVADPLATVVHIRQCIKTGNDTEYVKEYSIDPPKPWVLTLRGKDIGRYSTATINLYLKYGSWLARNWMNRTFYERPKIAIRETGSRITATLDKENRYFLSSLYSIYWRDELDPRDLNYLLGLLNSSVATFILHAIVLGLTEGAFTKARTNQLGRLPIKRINFSDSAEKALHDRMVELVEKMLALTPKLRVAKSESEKAALQNAVTTTDAEIDRLVYDLYGLTEEEIKIVEGKC